MRKKGIVLAMVLLSCALFLSGCTKAAALTETEQGIIAEYIAYMILKHDRGYDIRLREETPVTDNPSFVEEDFSVIGEEPSSDTSDSMAQVVEFSEIFANPDVEVAFSTYKECSVYPEGEEGGYFSLVAQEGKKWAVIEFTVKNLSKQQQKFSQLDSDVRYRLDLSSGKTVKPSMTLLMNDLQYMDTTLEAGEECVAVVVFSVAEQTSLKDAELVVYTDSKAATEKLK